MGTRTLSCPSAMSTSDALFVRIQIPSENWDKAAVGGCRHSAVVDVFWEYVCWRAVTGDDPTGALLSIAVHFLSLIPFNRCRLGLNNQRAH